MGNVMKVCSCVDLRHERRFSNVKIGSLTPSVVNNINNTENNTNMLDSNREQNNFFPNIHTNEEVSTNEEIKTNFIESYNSKNNFFYLINKITKLQLFYKTRLRNKKLKKSKLQPAKTINASYVANNIDNEGEEKKNENEEIFIKSDNHFNYQEFQQHISCMNLNNNPSQNNEENETLNTIPTKKQSTSTTTKQEMIKRKKTKDYIRAMVKRKTENKKYQIINPSQEGSLTNYMTCCEASFISAFKSSISNGAHNNGNDKEPRGCFLRKKLKFKFQGSVNAETKKKEGFGKITWKDESILLTTFTNNRANGIAYYKDKPNQSEFSGYYIDNNPNGYGLIKMEGIITEGIWDKNILTGIGKEYSDNDTYYQGEFTNSLKNGIGLFRWKDGTMYKGEWINNQMTGYGLISYNDDKLYFGQLNNGIMEGYGEFYWGNEDKKYIGYYKNDLKHGFGIYVSHCEEMMTYMGFWEKGKMSGIGLTIKGKNFKYGVWKNGSNEKWLQGPWELRRNITNQSNFKFVKLLEMSQNKIMEFLNKLEI